jgi:predicted nucleic acid-binding protein
VTKVLDANVLTYITSGDPAGELAIDAIEGWLRSGETLHTPELAPYEIANGLTRLVSAGLLAAEQVPTAIARLAAIPLELHRIANFPEIVRIAGRLGRQSAYDAAYVALALDLGAELWTFDGPLARNAGSIGLPVHLIGAR